MASTNTEKTDDEIDKYTKGLCSTLAHLLGLKEDRNGKLQVTVGVDKRDRECVNLENINLDVAQNWEAGTLLNTVADMNIFPVQKIQTIQNRLNEVSKKTGRASSCMQTPDVPPNGSATTALPKAPTAGAVVKAPVQEDPFSMSKGPSGFYPPRKVPQITTTRTVSDIGGDDNTLQMGQKKQFTFSKPKITETTPISVDHHSEHSSQHLRASLFSGYEPPPHKKPALDTGSGRATRVEGQQNVRKLYQNPPSYDFGSNSVGKSNQWNNNNSANLVKPIEDSQNDNNGGIGAFKTAYQQLLIDDKKKGIQRPLTARAPGLRRPPPKQEPEKQPRKSDEDEKVSDNPEVQEIMSHESMKNIDPKMVEAILNEVIQVSSTTWDDIAGLDGVKKIIREIIIWPMERPDIFTGLRAAPRGILFFGPPGTGKTMFGRVIATQSRSTFFNISASSLTSKWIGDGEKMVRALFAVARVKQPSVIFIDEIDSILTQRSDTEHESSRRLKTEFLIQFDGCATTTEDRILVIGVTNRPQELDEAARRRLVKRIYIPLPDDVARNQLVKNLIHEYTSDLREEDFDKIARMTEGYSGADMTSLCREAAYGPIREVGHMLHSLELSNVRPMRMKDFIQAQRQVKSSVAVQDVELYEEWDSKFGCHIGPSPTQEDSTQT